MEEDFNDMDDNVMDIDQVGGTDIKINPDFYIHKALVKAQECLADPDMRIGLLRYRQFIEHNPPSSGCSLETISRIGNRTTNISTLSSSRL